MEWGPAFCTPCPHPELCGKPPSGGVVWGLTWMTEWLGPGPGRRQLLAMGQGQCYELPPSIPEPLQACVTSSHGSGVGGRLKVFSGHMVPVFGILSGWPLLTRQPPGGQRLVCAQPCQGAVSIWTVTKAALLMAVLASRHGGLPGTGHRYVQRATCLCFSCSIGPGKGRSSRGAAGSWAN